MHQRNTTSQKFLITFSLLFFSVLAIAQADLVVVQSTLSNSIYATTLTNNNQCLVDEGCVSGFGTRDVIRFSTHVRNIGDQDFYVGQPPNSPSQSDQSESWEWDNCHNHWHYEGYAEYLLFDVNGNITPIGYKNGFCLIDIECDGGGTFTYNCSNQGISAGCGDIYGSGLPCQWVDVTDVPEGTYSLVVRANWDGSPDANGNFETTYANNEASVCFNLTRNTNNEVSINVLGSNSCDTNTECYDVTLNIMLDEYPMETSWEIQEVNGNVVYSGGPYTLTPALSNHAVTVCLPEGCYNLVMLDAQGDGLCCGFGQGSYALFDDSGVELASGGAFGSSETSNFCVGPPPPCIDADSDGLCQENDCNDNDATVPAPPGVACDDGNPNTVDDIILADGCTCEGTPISVPLNCDNVSIVASGDSIIISGFEGFPHVNIQIFTPQWSLAHACVDECGTGTLITAGYESGTHHVSVKLFDANWQYLCNIFESIEVTGTSGPCTDTDGDGICAAQDCDDSDPNLPATVGSACDDGNSLTENDVIQSDGCSCAGTIIQTGACSDILITPSAGLITIEGHASFPHYNVQIFNSTWTRVFHCVDECGPIAEVYLEEGLYHVSVKTFDEFWSTQCDPFVDVTVTGGGGPCPDADGDGICASQDCNDNDPLLPTTAGAACDDGNADTENDVIQADGCTCLGEIVATGDCALVDISTSGDAITIAGLGSFPHVNIQIFTPSWNATTACVDNCGNPHVTTGLSAGTHHVSVKLFDASWQYICDIFVDVEVAGSNAPNNLILDAGVRAQGVQLSWLATNEMDTKTYTLYRSTDGKNFEAISKLEPKVNGGVSVSYDYLDKDEISGDVIYQVEELSEDLELTYSARKAVKISGIERFELFPNPAGTEVFVDVNIFEGSEAEVFLMNGLGQVMERKAIEELDGSLIRFDLANVQPGIYAVYVKVDDRKGMVKMLVVEAGR